MRVSLFLCLLCFHTLWIHAQLCGYDYQHLFVLDIRHRGEDKQAADIEAWLVNEDGIAWEHNVWNKKTGNTRRERLRILPAEKVRQNGRIEFPNTRGYYVVIVTAYGPREPNPPVYIARIVSGDDTLDVRLPYEKSLNICQNNLACSGKFCNQEPMVHEDGTPFEPFAIVLENPVVTITRLREKLDRQIVKYDVDTARVRNDWDSPHEPNYQIQYTLRQVRILHHRSLEEIQRLVPSRIHPFNTFKTSVRRVDVFGDNPEGFEDFVITTNKVRNASGSVDEYNDYFMFNESTGLYERDAMLSDYPNVQIPDVNGPAIRLETTRTEDADVTRQYDLVEGVWQETHVHSYPVYVPGTPTITEVSFRDCISFAEDQVKWLPVMVGNGYTKARDTVIFYSKCGDLLKIRNMSPEREGLLMLPVEHGKPFKNNACFEWEQYIEPATLQRCEKAIVLGCEHEGTTTLTLRYFAAGSETAIKDERTGKVVCYRSSYQHGTTASELWVDEEGYPVESGEIWVLTGERIGIWHGYQRNTWKESTTSYGKSFSLMIPNADSTNITVEARTNGHWKPVPGVAQYMSWGIRIAPGTDSLRVVQGNRTGGTQIDYASLPDAAFGQVYLFRSGQAYINSMGTRMPIAYEETRYIIQWEWSEFNRPLFIAEDMEAAIALLQSRYPSLVFQRWKPQSNFYVVDLSSESVNRHSALRKALVEEKLIQYLSVELLVSDPPTTAMGYLRAAFYPRPGVSQAELTALLATYGFTVVSGFGMDGSISATCRSGVFDRTIVATLNALSAEPLIKYVAPEISYGIDATPDINQKE